MSRSLTVMALAGFALGLSSCSDGGTSVPITTQPISTTRSSQNLQVTYSVPRAVYSVGSDIPATVTVTNTGTTTLTLREYGCGPETTVYQQNSRIYSYPGGCVAIVRQTVLQPNETKTYDVPWDDTADISQDTPRTAPTGTYLLTPEVLLMVDGDTELRDISPDSISIRLR